MMKQAYEKQIFYQKENVLPKRKFIERKVPLCYN